MEYLQVNVKYNETKIIDQVASTYSDFPKYARRATIWFFSGRIASLFPGNEKGLTSYVQSKWWMAFVDRP